ncbi:homoserine dehydrogenase [Anaerophilus nitritogenes]|uniref:homoserine dehydrogenase n=1 Tax=Anaerophilus nitritogenes TaxID=2498136 RepID=UPI00101CAF6B|nr:homoserine dehydrogenase [Anaerophilus nitritogenes]
MQTIKIGLLGLGNIGKGVWDITKKNMSKIQSYTGAKLEIKKILVRNPAKHNEVPKEILTTNADEILLDPEIDLIIELIGGIDTAFSYIKKAIENHKHVVTANKAVIATYGETLHALSHKHKVALRYEASVGGGIPIINTLTKSLAANEIEEMVGIINGTTNYILTQMTENRMEFHEALKLAQEKGYAEADPSSDIEGEDAAFKLSILMSIAFGIYVSPNQIQKEGISKISKKDIDYATQLDYRIKLFATAKKMDNQLEFYVYPTLIPNNHPLASVNDEFNALFVKGNAVGELMLYGKGAGSLPTGSAVMGDVLEIAKGIVNKDHLLICPTPCENLPKIEEGLSQYYIRTLVDDEPGMLGKISSTFGKYGISLSSVVQRGKEGFSIPLVVVTHEVKKSILNKALEEILKNQMVIEISSILKVENLS